MELLRELDADVDEPGTPLELDVETLPVDELREVELLRELDWVVWVPDVLDELVAGTPLELDEVETL